VPLRWAFEQCDHLLVAGVLLWTVGVGDVGGLVVEDDRHHNRVRVVIHAIHVGHALAGNVERLILAHQIGHLRLRARLESHTRYSSIHTTASFASWYAVVMSAAPASTPNRAPDGQRHCIRAEDASAISAVLSHKLRRTVGTL